MKKVALNATLSATYHRQIVFIKDFVQFVKIVTAVDQKIFCDNVRFIASG